MIILKGVLPENGSIKGMAIFPFILVKTGCERDKVLINHEKIHLRQQLELLVIPFYLIYFVEWIFKGYKRISFEKEAYRNEHDLNYLEKRRIYGQWR